MNEHYNAFISYRHTDIDADVAKRIQHGLEHFRIPKPIGKKTGVNRIARIFRDKEELPLTSDLNDTITRALENSDYLIVICSPETRKSIWVQREIETFLKTHSKKNVFTVLANGEPCDTIPEVLLNDEVVDEATGDVTLVPVEPLSCDYRVSAGTAKREELPRLAAAIIGCGYDELIQRRRQYRMRRITALLSAALVAAVALAAFFIRTSLVIRENYEQALRNQSRYLASASEEAMADGDRMTAVLLALEALPGEDNERPWIADAEFALANATDAYSHDNSLGAAAVFETETTTKSFEVAPDGEFICAVDSRNAIRVWNTDTRERVLSLDPENEYDSRKVVLLSGGRLVVYWYDSIRCYDLYTSEILWEAGDFRENLIYFCAADRDNERLFALTNTELIIIDAQNGETLKTIQRPRAKAEEDEEIVYPAFKNEGSFSKNGRYAAFVISCSGDIYVVSVDTEASEMRCFDNAFWAVGDLYVFDNGDVAVMGSETQINSSGYYYGYVENVSCDIGIIRLAYDSGEELWRTVISFSQLDLCSRIGYSNGTLVCAVGNVCQRIDAESGELTGRGEAQAPIVNLEAGQEYSRLVLNNGMVCIYDYTENACRAISCFSEDIVEARVWSGDLVRYFVRSREDNRVIMYQNGAGNSNWYTFENTGDMSVDNVIVCGTLAAFEDYSDCLSVFDINEGTMLWRFDMAETLNCTRPVLSGITKDDKYLIIDSYEAKYLVELESGEFAEIDEHLAADCYTLLDMIGNDGIIYSVEEDFAEGEYYICALSAENGDKERARLVDIPHSGIYGFCADRGHALLATGDNIFYLCETDSGKCKELGTDAAGDLIIDRVCWNEDGSVMALVYSKYIELWNSDGALMTKLEADTNIASAAFSPDGNEIYAISADSLYRYDLKGDCVGITEIWCYSNTLAAAVSQIEVSWNYAESGELIVIVDGVATIIDAENWEDISYLTGCLCYSPEARLFISRDSSYGIGGVRHYTTAELIEIGLGIVGDASLSDEERAYYGVARN